MDQPKPKRMLEMTKENGKTIVKINFSSLDIIQTCMRKAQYRLHRHLFNETEGEALVFGKAIHKALEHWYCLNDENRVLTAHELALAYSLNGEPLNGKYDTSLDSLNEFVRANRPNQWLDESDKRSTFSGIKILIAYFKHYVNDGMEVLRDENDKPYIEREVEFKLFDSNSMEIHFHGQIDLILRNKITGQICVADHKTTSALGKDFYNRIKPNHQYTGYVMAAQECLGLDTSTFMVNGIQVAKTKQEFARQFTERTEEDFQELRDAYYKAAMNYIDSATVRIWPQNAPNPCAAYGGCQYLDICQAPKAIRENMIEGKYGKG